MSPHVADELSAYLDAELPPAAREAVERHLRECADCRAELAELEAVDVLARGLPAPAASPTEVDVAARVRGALGQARKRRQSASRWLWATAALLALTAVPWQLARTYRASSASPAAVLAPAPAAPPAAAMPQAGTGTEQDEPARQDAGSGRVREIPNDARGEASNRLRMQRSREPERSARAATAKDKLEKSKAAPPRDEGFAPPPPAAKAAPATSVPEVLRVERAEDAELADARPPAAQSLSGEAAAGGARLASAPAGVEPARRAAAPPGAAAASVEGAAARGRVQGPDEAAFRDRQRTALGSAAEARRARDAWSEFLREFPASARREDALRARLDADAAAYRYERRVDDLGRLRDDVADYLARPDAADAAHARALLDEAERFAPR